MECFLYVALGLSQSSFIQNIWGTSVLFDNPVFGVLLTFVFAFKARVKPRLIGCMRLISQIQLLVRPLRTSQQSVWQPNTFYHLFFQTLVGVELGREFAAMLDIKQTRYSIVITDLLLLHVLSQIVLEIHKRRENIV